MTRWMREGKEKRQEISEYSNFKEEVKHINLNL
jgi:hypothetical protein